MITSWKIEGINDRLWVTTFRKTGSISRTIQHLFVDAMGKHAVPRDQLTLHADRGGPMKAKTTALMLADLGVLRSHSWPLTSNDNPFSEAHFKTLKYQPEFPRRSRCLSKELSADFMRRL
jgi:putative transposase